MINTNLPIDISRIWTELQKDALNSSSPMRIRRIYPDSERDLYLGWSNSEDTPAFIVGGPREILSSILSELPILRGIDIKGVLLEKEQFTATIFLKDKRYSDVFAALADDLSTNIAPALSDADAIRILISRLNKWQSFFENYADGLGIEAQRGLWGELKFLKDYVIKRLGHNGINTWFGPDGAAQDFRFSNGSAEIKTTLALRARTIRISSEAQLNDSGIAPLFLVVMGLTATNGNGQTLPELVDEVRLLCSGNSDSASKLEASLLAVGYHDVHSYRYQDYYAINSEEFFVVTGDFPRITEPKLPQGVNKVSYSLNVDSCRPYAIMASEFVSKLFI